MFFGVVAVTGATQEEVGNSANIKSGGKEGLNFANALLRERRYDAAVQEYERFLKSRPSQADAAEATFGLARARLFLNQYREARSQFEAFLKLAPTHPNAATALFRVGETAYLGGDLDAARVALERFTAENAKHAHSETAWPYLGDVCFGLRDFPAAEKAYEKALEIAPGGRLADRSRYFLARTRAARGDLEGATRVFRDLSEKAEWKVRALYQLGLLLSRADRFDEAEAIWSELERATPKGAANEEYRLRRAGALARLNRGEQAERIWEELARIAAREAAVPAAEGLGIARFRRGEVDAAQGVWEAALRRFPDSPSLEYWLGEASLEKGDEATAGTYFRRVADRPGAGDWSDPAKLKLARISILLKDSEGARTWAEPLVGKKEGDSLGQEARLVLAQALQLEGEHEQVIQRLESLLKENTVESLANLARFTLAVSYRAEGEREKAAALLKNISAGEGSVAGPEAKYLLGVDAFEAGRFDEAEAHLTGAITGGVQDDSAASARAYLAVVKSRKGDATASAAELERLKNQPHAVEELDWALLTLAEDALEAQRYAEAISMAERVVKHDSGKWKDRSRLVLGTALLRSGDAARARDVLADWDAQHLEGTLGLEVGLTQALMWEATGSREEAIAALERVIARGMEADQANRARLLLARILVRAERWRDALGAYEEILSKWPETSKAIERLDAVISEAATAAVEAGELKRADGLYERLLGEFPTSKGAFRGRVHLAESAYQAGDKERVMNLLEPLLKEPSTPDDPEAVEAAVYRAGRLAADQGEWRAGEAHFRRLLREFGDGRLAREARFWLAECLFQKSDVSGAEREFAGLEDNAGPADGAWSIPARVRRAQCLVALERWKESLEQLERLESIELDANWQAERDLARGRALQAVARFTESREAYQRVVDLVPGSESAAKAQFLRGESYFHEKNYAEALREFQKVELLYRVKRWQAAALLEAGKIHIRQAQWAQAIERLEKLTTEFGDSGVAEEAKSLLAEAKRKQSG
jgi:TolA-binding protein